MQMLFLVAPAQAGVQRERRLARPWVLACAGTTHQYPQ
jgi:hypothetical protein